MSKLPKVLLGLLAFLFLFTALGLSPVSSKTYQALSKTETAGLFQNFRTAFQEDLLMSFSRPSTDPAQEGAVAMTTYAVSQKVLRFYFREIPEQVSKKVLIETVKLGYRLLNSPNSAYVLLDTLEKLSVAQANQIAFAWLTQNDLKAAGGDIDIPYTSYQGKDETLHFQYILIYRPLSSNTAQVVANFYSPKPVIPIDARGYLPWPFQAWRQEGLEKLNPFVVQIEGKVQKNYAAYTWLKEPQVTANFPSFVPEFSFQTSHLDIWHPFSWLKKRWSSLIKPQSEIVITPQEPSPSPDLQELKTTVQSLKAVVNQQLAASKPSPQTQSSQTQSSELVKAFKELAQTLTQQNQENSETWQQIRQIAQSQAELAKIQAEHNNNSSGPTTEKKQKEEPPSNQTSAPLCSTDNLPQPAWNKVIFNEINWMGNQSSPNNEWMELKNISSQTINLENWQIFNENRRLVIHFGAKDKILPHHFFLLERSDDQSVPSQKADKIYQGGLKNSNEALYLFDNQCQLQDFVQANPKWPGGDVSSHRTMERKADFEWQTSQNVGGTPKAANSTGYHPQLQPQSSVQPNPQLNPQPSSQHSAPVDNYPPVANAGPDQTLEFNKPIILDASQSGDNVGIVSYKWDTNGDSLWNITQTEPVLTLKAGTFSPGKHLVTLQVADAAGQTDTDQVIITILEIPKILINEVQTAGENSHDEFVELFNPNDREVDLTGWSLKKKTASGQEASLVSAKAFQGIIPARGYFLIVPPATDADQGYQGKEPADIYYSNHSSSVADNNTILLYNPLGNISDKVGFGKNVTDFEGAAYPKNPPVGFSLGRKWDDDQQSSLDSDNNADDVVIGIPTPKAQNQAYKKPSFDNVKFTLADSQSGSVELTTQPQVKVNIENDDEATAWFLAENQETAPAADDSHWLTEKPSHFTLSSGDGKKSISLWLKDRQGTISPQATATIILDENPPQAVLDLKLYPTKNNGEILLTWTAPGQSSGPAAAKYLLKESDQPITEDTWEGASDVAQNLAPQPPGQGESFVVTGLDSAKTYYFALKAQDQWGVLSPISNSPSRRAIAAQGTPDDPYVITNCQGLQNINQDLNASYVLVHSLDCAATLNWNNGLGFDPLGDEKIPFTGSLDGQGFTIDNLHINRTTNKADGWDVGFIGKAKAGADIKNLGLRNADIKGYKYVGGLIGFAQSFANAEPIQVDNCYTTGHLASSENQGEEGYIGGLIGNAQNTTINKSWSSMEIEASQTKVVGGLIGEMNLQSKVEHSFAKGKVQGNQDIGGLIGRLRSGTSVSQCWTQGEVAGDQAGGFVGITEGNIQNSYAQTKVTVTGQTGGGFAALAQGSIQNPAIFTHCYATGYVHGEQSNIQKAGFLNKASHARQTGCYWDVNASGQELSGGKAIGLTTAQMKDKTSFSDWDFETIWKIEEGSYPHF